LAPIWDAFGELIVSDYASLLSAASKYYQHPIDSVLDLACGTGLLTRQIAVSRELVVGLDASPAMLAVARDRTEAKNVQYAAGDFRSFRLQRTFDAAICGSESLNYVETPKELEAVFRCVQDHLCHGGLFFFDVLDEQDLLALNRWNLVGFTGGSTFKIVHFYEPESRVDECRCVIGECIERHRRMPIEVADVLLAAQESVDPNGDVTSYTYDAAGNQTLAANNAGTYTMAYDSVNRVTNVKEPFSLSLTYAYRKQDRT
jgi:YD repeat-containing protein